MSVITVEPLTGSIGAVLHGVDLTRPLGDDEAPRPRGAAAMAGRLRPRPGHHADAAGGVRTGARRAHAGPSAAGRAGRRPPRGPRARQPDYALGIGDRGNGTSYNNRWHTDVTFSARPPLASILAAKEIPAVGGDTLWADLVAAYRTLSAPVRRLLDPLVAVHDAARTFDRFRSEGGADRVATLAPVCHPVVRVHPETGERGLFVNPVFTSHIEGLSRLESESILEMLYAHIAAPEHVVRWRWRAGDVACGTTARPPTTPPPTTTAPA